MSPAQTLLRKLRDRQSTERGKMAELGMAESLTDETRAALDGIEAGTPDLERQLRAAQVAVDEEERTTKTATAAAPDAEARERDELRSRAKVGGYLTAALRGRAPSGAEAEFAQAEGVDGIPFSLWQPPRRTSDEERAITAAPGTTGINLDVLRPFVFAPSVVDRLMVDMPMVGSGTYASGTITTAATADAVPKGGTGTTGDVPETAAAFTVQTTTPHRIGASLNLAIEDIAAVGQDNFESLLRQHISLAVSDELDDQMLNGDGMNDDLTGIFERLTDPVAPAAGVIGFDGFIAAFADGIDGLWSNTMSEVSIVAGTDTYKLSAKTFRDRVIDTGQRGGVSLGDISFADYAMKHTAGWWTNKRMPATDANVQAAIMCRKGRRMMPSPMRMAVCPHWGYFTIDDIYTGAIKGQRRFVINTLVGDLILVQKDAYAEVAFRVSI